MNAPIVGAPGRWGPSTSTAGHVESILKNRESWRGIGMSDPRSCNLRKTKPMGPMILCSDLDCFKKCVELTRKERGEMAVSDS